MVSGGVAVHIPDFPGLWVSRRRHRFLPLDMVDPGPRGERGRGHWSPDQSLERTRTELAMDGSSLADYRPDETDDDYDDETAYPRQDSCVGRRFYWAVTA